MLKLLGSKKLLIGVVHLPATPGAPRFHGDRRSIARRAVEDARALLEGGCDALIVENFGDVPFFARTVPPETIASIALALEAVLEVAGGAPVGVNVLRNDARAALGLCAATGACFIRVNVHTGAAVTDQGLIEGDAAATLRERQRLCPDAALLCDVHVKHAVPLGGGSLEAAALDTLHRGLADALIVSGSATGAAPDAALVATVRRAAPHAPLLIGSGLDAANASRLLADASGAIVGTALKRNGAVLEPVEARRVRELRSIFDAAEQR
ncbi:MAG: BtpA/SgcQ family protein [Planctomycetes bacterium]|nr:BtpA/SgcQ family protein [Planctomycetota bacterium]